MDRTFSLLLTALQRMHSVQEVLVFAYTEERQILSPWVKIILNAPSVQIFKVIQTESTTRSSGPTGCFFLTTVLFYFVSFFKKTHEVGYQAGWMDGHTGLKGYPSKKSLYFHGNLGYKQHDL